MLFLRKNLVLLLAALAVLALVLGMIGCMTNPTVLKLLNGAYPTVLVEPDHALEWESKTPFMVRFLGVDPCKSESSSSGNGPHYSWTCTGLQMGTFMYVLAPPPPPTTGTPAPPPPAGPPNFLSVGHCDGCKSSKFTDKSVGHCDICKITTVPGRTATPAGYPIGLYCGSDGAAAYPPNYKATSGESVSWIGTGTGADDPNWTVTFTDDKACTNGKNFSSQGSTASCTAGVPNQYTYRITLDGCKTAGSATVTISPPPQ